MSLRIEDLNLLLDTYVCYTDRRIRHEETSSSSTAALLKIDTCHLARGGCICNVTRKLETQGSLYDRKGAAYKICFGYIFHGVSCRIKQCVRIGK